MAVQKPTILITGGSGQLSAALKACNLSSNFDLIFLNRESLDITNLEMLTTAITTIKPDFIINTAAYTAVDAAETDQANAYAANVLGTQNIARSCEQRKIPFIHLSTDYVFDGALTQSTCEDAKANPVNYYGKSKWLGEEAIRKYCGNYLILRVSGIFSEYGKNFLKTILRLAQETHELKIVNDQITCPTYAGDIAQAILTILMQSGNHQGIYHFTNAAPVTWFDFASHIIAKIADYDLAYTTKLKSLKLTPIHTAQFQCAAKRPRYSVLNCAKILRDFAIQQTHWQLGIEKSLQALLLNPKKESNL